MERYYRFAGLEIAVSVPECWAYPEDRSLAPFCVTSAVEPIYFRYELVDTLTPPPEPEIPMVRGNAVCQQGSRRIRYLGFGGQGTESAYGREECEGRNHFFQLKNSVYPSGISAKTVLNTMDIEHLLAQVNGFVLHSSYIQVGNRAILFTAPSGVGKSTQAELWKVLRGARIINGDRAAIRVTPDGILAEGIPFAGSSPYCEDQSLPLAAIVYLSQAPVTSIRKLRGAEAFRRVWEGISVHLWDRQDVETVSAAVEQMLRTVPVYSLACTPDETAVAALEALLERDPYVTETTV